MESYLFFVWFVSEQKEQDKPHQHSLFFAEVQLEALIATQQYSTGLSKSRSG
jgi:hypothetical protein